MQTPSKEWIVKMAKLEEGHEVTAGNLQKVGIAEVLRSQIKQGMKTRSGFVSLLRFALSEVEAVQNKLPVNSEFDKLETCGLNAIRKIINDNVKSMELMTAGSRMNEESKLKTKEENDYLTLFLPQNLSAEQIREILLPLSETIRSLDSNKAMGPAFKALKQHGSVDSSIVKSVIEEIKNG